MKDKCLYHIVRENGVYYFIEYECPEGDDFLFDANSEPLSKKVCSLEGLFYRGLIPHLLYYSTRDSYIDEWLIAVKNGKRYLSKVLEEKNGIVKGETPTIKDVLIDYLLIFTYIIAYTLIVLFLVKVIVR